MKVVFLSRQFFPDIGGVEKHVLEISKQLIARGHDVTVISEGLESQNFSLFQKQTKIHVYKISVEEMKKRKSFLFGNVLEKQTIAPKCRYHSLS